MKLGNFLKVCRLCIATGQRRDTEEQSKATQTRVADIATKSLDLSVQHISYETWMSIAHLRR